jgi:Transglycosylase SLT domain
VIRLWPRIGVFRMLSVAVVALGVVGGIYLSAGRQSQQRVVQSAQSVQSEQDELRELKLMSEDRRRASVASRSAQREAQAKADAAAAAAADQAKAAEDAARKNQPKSGTPGTPAKKPDFGPIPASCGEFTGNVAIGCTLLLQAGFGLDQMTCLKNLWMKESGWNEKAYNSSTGAGGIPQALPRSKMSVYGADYLTNPATQIKWGLNYIKTKYTTPCNAWSTWQSKGWY